MGVKELLRTFIAVDLEETAKKEVLRVIERFKGIEADIKLVEAGNLHLTLKFLGSTKEDSIPSILESLKRITSTRHCFNIYLKSVGTLR